MSKKKYYRSCLKIIAKIEEKKQIALVHDNSNNSQIVLGIKNEGNNGYNIGENHKYFMQGTTAKKFIRVKNKLYKYKRP